MLFNPSLPSVTNCHTFSDPSPSSVTYLIDGPYLRMLCRTRCLVLMYHKHTCCFVCLLSSKEKKPTNERLGSLYLAVLQLNNKGSAIFIGMEARKDLRQVRICSYKRKTSM